MPRTIAVSLLGLPATAALPVPTTLTFSWSTAAWPISAPPEPWTDKSNFRPFTRSIASVPEPVSQAD